MLSFISQRRKTLKMIVWIGAACWLSVFVVCLFVRARRDNINIDGYMRIKRGMTEKELEVILGRPAGDYSTCHVDYLLPNERRTRMSKGADYSKDWISDEIEITVFFKEGKVMWEDFYDGCNMTHGESFLDLIRGWMGL